jgi:predicted aspartyl protease
MTKYSSTYSPPAPIAKIALKKIETEERLRDVEVFIDTGSDITLLPKTALDSLGFDPSEVEKFILSGFDGAIVESEIYSLK